MQRQTQDSAFTVLMSSGFVAIPGILLREYKRLGLSDEEMMLVLHVMQFRQEGIEFPTPRELSERMTLHPDVLAGMVQQLVQRGLIDIDEHGIGHDSLSLRPLYAKLAKLLEPKPLQPPAAKPLSSYELLETREQQQNLFALFEQEFGRPISPIEYERISCWIDQDHYREELIREALKEAVLAGKFNFRYIDRILFEWGKNNIRSLQDLTVHREQFRNRIPTRGQNNKNGSKNGSKNGNAAKPAVTADEDAGNKYDMFYKVYGGGNG
ncbi:DNA replication protein DnaD [Tumebacillus sp. BK434]|uniref:DnaD domain-containing protein n=1 Tax=Tumebacillus sp. BK434 TaxID=2512169 RepID=UPI0010537C6C|nr:DnaD domain-containing protein [Tumebacillus sp. BK434]TCP59261.1 DNA replication protein DnaD [Tumebacillus sp. BK434]